MERALTSCEVRGSKNRTFDARVEPGASSTVYLDPLGSVGACSNTCRLMPCSFFRSPCFGLGILKHKVAYGMSPQVQFGLRIYTLWGPERPTFACGPEGMPALQSCGSILLQSNQMPSVEHVSTWSPKVCNRMPSRSRFRGFGPVLRYFEGRMYQDLWFYSS